MHIQTCDNVLSVLNSEKETDDQRPRPPKTSVKGSVNKGLINALKSVEPRMHKVEHVAEFISSHDASASV